MLFQFNITLTEDDYLAFNCFHSLESIRGKIQLRKTGIYTIIATAVLTAFFVLILGCTTLCATYIVLLWLFTLLYILSFKKLIIRNIKAQIKQLKKIGKLPFDAKSTLEFYDDKVVEIAASKRTEQGYDAIERICILQDSYIFLYNSSVGAYILPIPQIKTQANQDEFMQFLSGKCSTVEYYE